MGRKRDRKQANMVLGGGASGRRVKLDLWTPDPIAEARKAKEAAPAAAVASATGAAAESRAKPGVPTADSAVPMTAGPETAASGLGHLLGTYSDDSGEEEGPDKGAAPVQAGAKGEDLDDKVKSFLAELETDGLLENGADAVPKECPDSRSAPSPEQDEQTQPREHEGGGPEREDGPAASAEESQPEGTVNASSPKEGEDEDIFEEEGWQAVCDISSGEHYYWNTVTRVTTWDKPRTVKRRKGAQAGPEEGASAQDVGEKVESPGLSQGGGGQPETAPAAGTDREREGSEEGAPKGTEDEPLGEKTDATDRASAEQEQSGSAEPFPEGSLANGASDGASSEPVERGVRAGSAEIEAHPVPVRRSSRLKKMAAGSSPDEDDGLEGPVEDIDGKGQMATEEQASGEALEAEEAVTRALEAGEQDEEAGRAGPGMRDQGVGTEDEGQAEVHLEEARSRERKELVDRVVEEGETLVRRLQDRAGSFSKHVSPLARLAIQAQTLADLAWILQRDDSVNAVWIRIGEQLSRLSAHATEAERTTAGKPFHTTLGDEMTTAGEQVDLAAVAERQTDDEIEALLEDVEPSGLGRPGSGGGVPGVSSRLFPIPLELTAVSAQYAPEGLVGGFAANGWQEESMERGTGSGVQGGAARSGSSSENALSKAELLRRKTADLQKRMAAIRAFTTPLEKPGSERVVLSGLASYGSSDEEMEEGEIAAAEELAEAKPPSRDGPFREHFLGDENQMDVEPGYPPGEAASFSDGAVGPPYEDIATNQGLYDSHYHVLPPDEYASADAVPEPPQIDAVYDPFADPQPPPPTSPPPADTWQAHPPPPLPEDASFVEPQPVLEVAEAAVVQAVVAQVAEPPKMAQGPVLSAPPVRTTRPSEAARAEPSRSAAASAASAAAAAKKVKTKKAASAPVGLGVSSAKKVSSLMDKWKAAAQDGQDGKQKPLTAQELERKKAQELEEWRRQQIASGEADKNANFAPVEGDWRKRVKKAKQQAEKQAARQGAASSAGAVEKGGRGKVDLAALGEGLPPGWQPFLDPTSGEVYYGNLQTSETSWERPG